MADQSATTTWDNRRGSGSSGWSNASSTPASINQRPRVPLDNYQQGPSNAGMVHRNPFSNPSPSPSVYGDRDQLNPPNAPFAANGRPGSSGGLTINSRSSSKDGLNLSVSYLPSKFSRPLSPGISYRKANKGASINNIIKRGGGRDAFATGASRMPGNGDEDYDGVVPGKRGKLHWNRFKWILLCTNTLVRRGPLYTSQLRLTLFSPRPAHPLRHGRPNRMSRRLVQRLDGGSHHPRREPRRARRCVVVSSLSAVHPFAS